MVRLEYFNDSVESLRSHHLFGDSVQSVDLHLEVGTDDVKDQCLKEVDIPEVAATHTEDNSVGNAEQQQFQCCGSVVVDEERETRGQEYYPIVVVQPKHSTPLPCAGSQAHNLSAVGQTELFGRHRTGHHSEESEECEVHSIPVVHVIQQLRGERKKTAQNEE